MKRVFIIHGWSGSPEEGWFPWLRDELRSRGIFVSVPDMPNPDEPIIEDWIHRLDEVVGNPDVDTFFVGHSIGRQAILRYIERSGEPIGGAVFVAGWLYLQNINTDEERRISKPWLETPIDLHMVRTSVPSSIAIFSDDDPVVPLEKNRSMFASQLDSRILIESGKGHIGGDDGVTILPSALTSLLDLMGG